MPSHSPCSRGLVGVALAGSLCLGVSPAFAQTAADPQVSVGRPAVVRVTPLASIQGRAWRADNTAIPNAIIRLRNVVSGKIEAITVANEAGQFAFNGIAEGTYLVELVNEDSKVLAVGQTFTAVPGETATTFVRLGTKVPWFNGLFGNASLAVAASAAAAGVVALSAETVTPVSPNR